MDICIDTESTFEKSEGGAEASITFYPEKVVLTRSQFGLLGVNRKIENYDLFNSITKDIPGLDQPKILSRDSSGGKYEMERAEGFNLVGNLYLQGGGLVDFYKICPEFKFEAMLTYLRVIGKLNESGYSFKDHKSDSIFINPMRETISIVDVGVMEKYSNPEYAWNGENHRLSGNRLKDVLSSFYTRGMDFPRVQHIIPTFVQVTIDNIDNKERYSSAQEVIETCEKYRNRETRRRFPNTREYYEKAVIDQLNRSKLGSYITGWNSIRSYQDYLINKVERLGRCYDVFANYDYEMIFSEIETLGLFESGHPQMQDRFLGIKEQI